MTAAEGAAGRGGLLQRAPPRGGSTELRCPDLEEPQRTRAPGRWSQAVGRAGAEAQRQGVAGARQRLEDGRRRTWGPELQERAAGGAGRAVGKGCVML